MNSVFSTSDLSVALDGQTTYLAIIISLIVVAQLVGSVTIRRQENS